MKEDENLHAVFAVLVIVVIASALIVVFQRGGKDGPKTVPPESDTAISEEFSSIFEEILSPEVSELSSESRSVREEVSSAVEAAETILTGPVCEITTEEFAADINVGDNDYDSSAGDYIGYFELTAYEWTGQPMADGQYPYYGAVACNSLALGTWIYIEGYGTFQVCDRGGMGNNVIDIYLGDPYVCEQFGRRGANVYYAN